MSLLRPFLFAAAFAAACAAAEPSAPRAARPPAPASGLALQGGAAAARSVEAAGTPCDIAAYVVDPDPRGLNVRSGPGKAFPVVGTIPYGGGSAVGVKVTGSTGQWLRIKDAETQESGETAFEGEGWVFAPMLATETRNYTAGDPRAPVVKLYKAPSIKSAVLTRLPNETEVRLLGCKGDWAQVQFKKVTGWLDPESQCASTLTNCS